MYIVKLKKADHTISLRKVTQSITLQQTGRRGPQGETGEGVPVGGTIGQVLTKQSNVNFDTDWEEVPSAPVQSVNGQTGVVVLDTDDIGEGVSNLYFTDQRAIDALTGQNISIFNNDAGYLTDVNWGDIGGTLSNQVDLQNALDSKADQSDLDDYVLKSGDTMTGSLGISSSSGDILDLNATGGNNTILRLRDDGAERGAIFSLNGSSVLNLRSQGELRLISNNSGTAQTTIINNGTFGIGTQTLQVGPQSDSFQTGFSIIRNGVETGRIDNNGNGMRLQAFGGNLYLRNNNSSFGRGLTITQTDLVQVDTNMTLDINSQPVINVPTPTQDDHAVNKAYVDNAAALNDWQPEDYNFYSWAYDVSAAANSATMTSGTMFTIRLKVSEAQDISSAHFVCSGSGSMLTDGYVAVYQDGNLLVQSADISADFTSTGSKNVTFASTTVQPGYIDLGIWFTGTGMPNLGRSSQLSGTAGFLTGDDARFATADSGLTDTAPATLGAKTSSNFNVWGAVGFLV